VSSLISQTGHSSGYPRILISVRDVVEALAAVEGRADIIDIKDPAKGSLGAASPEVWTEISDRIGGSHSWSIAMGELEHGSPQPKPLGLTPAFAKVGLAELADNKQWRQFWAEWREQLPATTAPVAVAYADQATARCPAVDEIVVTGASMGCQVLLIDTFDKSHGGLLDHVRLEELAVWCRLARRHRMRIALAGSLSAADVPNVLSLRPDWLAVRGAVCTGNRNSSVCRQKVSDFVDSVRRMSRRVVESVDYSVRIAET